MECLLQFRSEFYNVESQNIRPAKQLNLRQGKTRSSLTLGWRLLAALLASILPTHPALYPAAIDPTLDPTPACPDATPPYVELAKQMPIDLAALLASMLPTHPPLYPAAIDPALDPTPPSLDSPTCLAALLASMLPTHPPTHPAAIDPALDPTLPYHGGCYSLQSLAIVRFLLLVHPVSMSPPPAPLCHAAAVATIAAKTQPTFASLLAVQTPDQHTQLASCDLPCALSS